MLEKIVRFQIKYSQFLLFFLLLIIGFSAYYATNLEIDPNISKLVSDTSEYNTNDRILNSAFESNDFMSLLVKVDDSSIVDNPRIDFTTDEMQVYFDSLEEVVSQSQYVVNILEPDISDDKKYAVIGIQINRPSSTASIQEVKEEIDSLVEEVASPPGVDVFVTGFPVLLNQIMNFLINDSLRTVLITIVFILLVIYWYSRDIYFTLITVATPVTSLIMLAAFMVFLQIPVTLTLASIGVLILGLGADYSIHMAIHYRAARRALGNHTKAMIQTIRDLIVPITASFMTTLAGFTALIFGVSPSSQSQGMVLSLGIAIIYTTTIVLFPILLSVFSENISVKSNASFRKLIDVLSNLAVVQSRFPKTVILVVSLITVVMVYGASQVEFSTSNSNWIPDKDPVSKSFREITYVYGDSESLRILVMSEKGDLRDPQVAKDVLRIKSTIESISNVDTITTPYDNLDLSRENLHDKLSNTELKELFNKDYTLTTINIRSQDFGQDENGDSTVLKEIREIVDRNPIYNSRTSLYGNPVRFEEVGDSLEKDAGVTTVIGLVLVFVVATAIYMSFVVGLISLVPIVIAVIWAIGFMGFFKVPFTSLSTGIVSLVLGVGVDFSIHLVDSIKKHLKTKDVETAIRETLSSSGAAIVLSSFTTFIGFMALVFASLLGTQRLGYSLALSILSVFLITITLVPAVMSLTSKKEKKHLKNIKTNIN